MTHTLTVSLPASARCQGGHSIFRRSGCALVIGLSLVGSSLAAQDAPDRLPPVEDSSAPPDGAPRPAISQNPTAAAKAPAPVPVQVRGKRAVKVGLLILALVTAAGLTLLTLTILGGTAARRALRSPVDDAARVPPGPPPLPAEPEPVPDPTLTTPVVDHPDDSLPSRKESSA